MTTQIPSVSIVIPMYNAEKYIGACLESLLAQTFQNFEVIVVDDRSTDSSVVVVESYRERFNGLLTLSRVKEKLRNGAPPRNKGLKLSRGEYVFFVDADDLLTETALAELYSPAKDFDADVVYCEKYFIVSEDETQVVETTQQKGELVADPTLETGNLSERVQRLLQGYYQGSTCLKFVRRDFLLTNKIFFPNVRPSEDIVWTCGLIFYAKRFLHVPNAVYKCRDVSNSVMRAAKTPQQEITFWLNPIVRGLKALDEFMRRLDFFQRNENFRYAILEDFILMEMGGLLNASQKLPPFKIYETIRREFGESFGEHDVLIPALCTVLNTYQKIHAVKKV